MGVCGVGKSTIGSLLAQRIGACFVEGDDFHPEANVKKMAHGMALNDADRWPWLKALRASITLKLQENKIVVVACSALKASYREVLCHPGWSVLWVHLHGPRALIQERLLSRQGHFMPASLLEDQIQTLEVPKNALTIFADQPSETIIANIGKFCNIDIFEDGAGKKFGVALQNSLF
ncbi:MAG TPA: gluconokinase [Magnetococcales bacterium]|nr:gluconokinase [Magnetococcales bacterium]